MPTLSSSFCRVRTDGPRLQQPSGTIARPGALRRQSTPSAIPASARARSEWSPLEQEAESYPTSTNALRRPRPCIGSYRKGQFNRDGSARPFSRPAIDVSSRLSSRSAKHFGRARVSFVCRTLLILAGAGNVEALIGQNAQLRGHRAICGQGLVCGMDWIGQCWIRLRPSEVDLTTEVPW